MTDEGGFIYQHEYSNIPDLAHIIANTCNNDVKVIELVINEALLGRTFYANDIPLSV